MLSAAHVDLASLPLRVARQSRAARAVKRLFDFGAALGGLAVCAPLLAVAGALIHLDSRGPVIFRQARVGRGQRPYVMIKLRTMDAHGQVTRIGRLLRPTGLDELPQLWHVLTGEMSLIGPRPERVDRVPGYQRQLPHYGMRHLMRPGITGWAQVNGLRGETASIPTRVRYDLHYVASWSLLLDARILARTASTVWRDTRRSLGG